MKHRVTRHPLFPPRSVRATREEQRRALPGDERIPDAIDSLTHGVTIRRPPRDVWPWLVQMGAGSRAGWYSYDWLDNRRRPSATRIVPELQHPVVGTIFPALPDVTEGFVVLTIEPERILMLGWPAPNEVTWTFCLDEVAPGVTRLLVRARGGPGYRFHGLPLLLTRLVVRVVHFIMQRKQLLGIARRAETAMSHPSALKTRNTDVYTMWLAATLDRLHLDRIFFAGRSHGAWLALPSGRGSSRTRSGLRDFS